MTLGIILCLSLNKIQKCSVMTGLKCNKKTAMRGERQFLIIVSRLMDINTFLANWREGYSSDVYLQGWQTTELTWAVLTPSKRSFVTSYCLSNSAWLARKSASACKTKTSVESAKSQGYLFLLHGVFRIIKLILSTLPHEGCLSSDNQKITSNWAPTILSLTLQTLCS